MIFGKLKLWAGAFAVAILAALVAGRKNKEAQYLKGRVAALKEARKVQDEVNQLGDDRLHDELDKWMRDDD